jgi:transposase
VAKSKTRNLIERLGDYEDDTLRFMTDKEIPFTNNRVERDLRMIKVHQKISGCFGHGKGRMISVE